MSDLSRLLDDVYGDSGANGGAPSPTLEPHPCPDPAAALAALPDWALDSVLDEAFADWVPGPPTVAVDVLDAPTEPVAHHEPAGALRSPRSDLAEEPAGEPVALPRTWSRADDDILPTRSGRHAKRGRAAAAARPAGPAPAPVIEAFAAPGPPPAKRNRLRRHRG